MTQDEIIRMAREAGFGHSNFHNGFQLLAPSTICTNLLTRFAALVAAHEREKLTAEQKPVAEVVLRNQTVGFGRTEERKDVMFLADVYVGTKLYAKSQQQAEQEPVVKPMDKAERENWYKEVIAATEDVIAEKERIAEHRALITRNNAIIAADREKNK